MAVRDHASLVTHRNRNLASTTVINSSQRRTCATMLALTSHYMATNAKHPRYAPGLFGWLATHCNRRGRYRLREKVCREFRGCARFALGSSGVSCRPASAGPGGPGGGPRALRARPLPPHARRPLPPRGPHGDRRPARDAACGPVPQPARRGTPERQVTPAAHDASRHTHSEGATPTRHPRRKLERRWDKARTSNHGSLLGAQGHRGEPGGETGVIGAGADAGAGACERGHGRTGRRAGAGEMGVSARTDDVGERWGLGAGRDIRRVRRWRGRDGRDATGACDRSNSRGLVGAVQTGVARW